MRLKKQLLLTAILFLVAVGQTYAIPAYPDPVKVTQPDGSTITVIKKGGPFFHYDTTEDGILIAQDKQGIYRYAEFNDQGNIVTTLQKAQDKSERSTAEANFVQRLKTVAESEAIIQKVQQERTAALHTANVRSNFPKVGSPKSLVILVNFANLNFVIDNPKEEFYKLLNEKGYSKNGGTGSARDYFIDNSMGTFSPEFEVIGPFTLPKNYDYYGKNIMVGGRSQDARPEQMIIDACRLADEAGVDFSQYDTDNDGVVDNIFVYYAGHNEAEHGGANTVWPHRFSLNGTYTTFDGKRILDYACTSELRKSAGTLMCGIGTFTHEFGHVLGLDDLYPTRGQRHNTLGRWDIMASGPYNNEGRTPPAYSAFQRFRLGFMTPKILKNPASISLKAINISNEAYLISETENHNLNGENPDPKEFFLLENRQRTGWDRFLPGHGMLITKVKYDRYKWIRNEPNNNPKDMGVDLIEADGQSSRDGDAGDPFPGLKKVTEYTPKLQDGKVLDKQTITDIAEFQKIISFKYKGGKTIGITPPENLKAEKITYKGFDVLWDKVENDNPIVGYYITLCEKNDEKKDSIDGGWSKEPKYKFNGLISNKEYEVKVRAKDVYDKLSDYSKVLLVKTLPYPFKEDLRCTVRNGKVKVFVPQGELSAKGGATVNVYNALGQKIFFTSTTKEVLELSNLPRNIVLIVQSGKQHKKIIIN